MVIHYWRRTPLPSHEANRMGEVESVKKKGGRQRRGQDKGVTVLERNGGVGPVLLIKTGSMRSAPRKEGKGLE